MASQSQKLVSGVARGLFLRWRAVCFWGGARFVSGVARGLFLVWRAVCFWGGARFVSGVARGLPHRVGTLWQGLFYFTPQSEFEREKAQSEGQTWN